MTFMPQKLSRRGWLISFKIILKIHFFYEYVKFGAKMYFCLLPLIKNDNLNILLHIVVNMINYHFSFVLNQFSVIYRFPFI